MTEIPNQLPPLAWAQAQLLLLQLLGEMLPLQGGANAQLFASLMDRFFIPPRASSGQEGAPPIPIQHRVSVLKQILEALQRLETVPLNFTSPAAATNNGKHPPIPQAEAAPMGETSRPQPSPIYNALPPRGHPLQQTSQTAPLSPSSSTIPTEVKNALTLLAAAATLAGWGDGANPVESLLKRFEAEGVHQEIENGVAPMGEGRGYKASIRAPLPESLKTEANRLNTDPASKPRVDRAGEGRGRPSSLEPKEGSFRQSARSIPLEGQNLSPLFKSPQESVALQEGAFKEGGEAEGASLFADSFQDAAPVAPSHRPLQQEKTSLLAAPFAPSFHVNGSPSTKKKKNASSSDEWEEEEEEEVFEDD